MTAREKIDRIRVARNYLSYAKAIAQDGFVVEAARIIDDVNSAITSGDVPLTKPKGNVKLAIRGRGSWEDYLQEGVSGAGWGAGAGAAAGLASAGVLSAPAAAAGAGIGAAGGLAFKGMSDLWYHGKGDFAQAQAQAKDFVGMTGKAAKLLSKLERPDLAQRAQMVAQQVSQRVDQIHQARRNQLSESYGVDPQKGFWNQLFKNPQGALARYVDETFYAARKSPEMTREAQVDTDVGAMGGELSAEMGVRRFLNKRVTPKLGPRGIKGLAAGGAGLVGGAITGIPTELAYQGTENLIRGKSGRLRLYASEMQKMGEEIARALQDPQFAQAGQNMAQILQEAIA